MSLLVTSILTLVTAFAGLRADLPPVSYMKSVDIWVAGCLNWVFAALEEFMVTKVVYQIKEYAKYQYQEDHLKLFNWGQQVIGFTPVKENKLLNGQSDKMVTKILLIYYYLRNGFFYKVNCINLEKSCILTFGPVLYIGLIKLFISINPK